MLVVMSKPITLSPEAQLQSTACRQAPPQRASARQHRRYCSQKLTHPAAALKSITSGAAAAATADAAAAEFAASARHCLDTCSVTLRPGSSASMGNALFLTSSALPGDVVLRVPLERCLVVDYASASGMRLPPGTWPRLQRGVQMDDAAPFDILLVSLHRCIGGHCCMLLLDVTDRLGLAPTPEDHHRCHRRRPWPCWTRCRAAATRCGSATQTRCCRSHWS